MLEKDIEGKLRDRIKALGGMCLKFEPNGYTGAPDRIILLPGGIALFAETKQPGKKERRRQDYVQKTLRAMGFTVFSTVDSVEKIETIVAHCEEVLARGTTL